MAEKHNLWPFISKYPTYNAWDLNNFHKLSLETLKKLGPRPSDNSDNSDNSARAQSVSNNDAYSNIVQSSDDNSNIPYGSVGKDWYLNLKKYIDGDDEVEQKYKSILPKILKYIHDDSAAGDDYGETITRVEFNAVVDVFIKGIADIIRSLEKRIRSLRRSFMTGVIGRKRKNKRSKIRSGRGSRKKKKSQNRKKSQKEEAVEVHERRTKSKQKKRSKKKKGSKIRSGRGSRKKN